MSDMVHVINHPLVQHKLTIMRDKETSTKKFRDLLSELSLLLGYEVTRNLKTKDISIETPMGKTQSPALQDVPVMVSILRAGNGILNGMMQLMPTAPIGHIGIYRDPKTLVPVEYYYKVPPCIKGSHTIVVDPMLATGHSAVAAIDRLKKAGPSTISFVCLLASPEGVEYFREHQSDVEIYTASIDEKLDENGYIIPGLGDAGDRLYGTNH